MANSGGEDDDWEEGFGDEEERAEGDDDVMEVDPSGSRGSVKLDCENRTANRPASRETGLEMPCYPASDLLWVQITQSYPDRLRFSSLPCPQSPCHTVIDPVFKEGFFQGKNFFFDQALRRAKQGTKGGGWRSVPYTLCRLFQTCRRIGVYLSSEEYLHRRLTRQGLG